MPVRAGLLLLLLSGLSPLGWSSTGAAQSPDNGPDSWLSLPVAVLQGLNKVSARVSTFDVPVDGTGRFGALEISVRACRERPLTEMPESVAFLEISDRKDEDEPVPLFTGWMFASSPALNALEHPVYDVWVVDCRSASTSSPESGSQ